MFLADAQYLYVIYGLTWMVMMQIIISNGLKFKMVIECKLRRVIGESCCV